MKYEWLTYSSMGFERFLPLFFFLSIDLLLEWWDPSFFLTGFNFPHGFRSKSRIGCCPEKSPGFFGVLGLYFRLHKLIKWCFKPYWEILTFFWCHLQFPGKIVQDISDRVFFLCSVSHSIFSFCEVRAARKSKGFTGLLLTIVIFLSEGGIWYYISLVKVFLKFVYCVFLISFSDLKLSIKKKLIIKIKPP